MLPPERRSAKESRCVSSNRGAPRVANHICFVPETLASDTRNFGVRLNSRMHSVKSFVQPTSN